MKSLSSYIIEVLGAEASGIAQSIGDMEAGGKVTFATPSNTMGMGNPKLPTPEEFGTEPFGTTKKMKPTFGKEKNKKKKMKSLKEQLEENLFESIKKLPVSAYNLPDIIEFAATFDPNTKNEEEWMHWDDFYVDYEALQKDKAFCRKFCKACKDVVDKKVNFGKRGLGNFPWDDSRAQSELIADEFGAKEGDTYHLLTSDGDNGEFFYFEEPKNAAAAKSVEEIMNLTIGSGNWGWETATC